ncbi:hypothetical protein QU481_01225 [Crenobacter sp. SG2303]|uniref:Uncharacterized protein n=1 Tax=Crenobacter oryzisoli TaxID=3056844 RepID=A0ABT7XIB4_9NEIS|nr:hypothetical protein [Crenobacter sp. SG2303]MDN0073521.1 hypothetical protein [Crenobacter sp. SG2303]
MLADSRLFCQPLTDDSLAGHYPEIDSRRLATAKVMKPADTAPNKARSAGRTKLREVRQCYGGDHCHLQRQRPTAFSGLVQDDFLVELAAQHGKQHLIQAIALPVMYGKSSGLLKSVGIARSSYLFSMVLFY